MNRLDLALQKLYNAFDRKALHPECCKQCAVGTILDGTDAWKHLSDDHGSLRLNYIGQVHEALGRRFNGYLPSELLQIERTFLAACGYVVPLRYTTRYPFDPTDPEVLFQGLDAVGDLLCKMDGAPEPTVFRAALLELMPKDGLTGTVLRAEAELMG